MSTTETTTTAPLSGAPAHRATETPPEEDEALTKDAIFHILQTRRRRDVLRFLGQVDGPVRMRDLAEQVAAWENDTTVSALSSEQRQRVYISLYQSHLPKLDDEGVIEYDQNRGIVERTETADLLDPYLDDDDETVETSPAPYYYGAGALGVVLLAGGIGGALTLASVVLGTLILATFVGITAYTHSRR